jgi:hypothetical protein
MIHATPGIMTGVAEGVGDTMITGVVVVVVVVVAVVADGIGIMSVVGTGIMTEEIGTEIGETDMLAGIMKGEGMGGGIESGWK